MKLDWLTDIPQSLHRLGEEIFIKVPLYKAKAAYTPIYINPDLYAHYIEKKDFDWDEAAHAITNLFSNTLNPENSNNKQIGWAYVDKQADPLGLALSDNLGSGRAYYLGKYFNIKGEKTPLAISKQEPYFDGMLNMENGIWETLLANSLQGSFDPDVFPVLAILKLEEKCKGKYQGKEIELNRVQIIRIDNNAALDRVSHLFYLKKEMKKESLLSMAESFGRLEARKFIERILHGMWSAGNISPQGHLIDLQTTCAVKGRFPQYIGTKWHQENYFGYEYLGQLKVLETLLNTPSINTDSVCFSLLKEQMDDSLHKNVVKDFFYLMGFPCNQSLFAHYYYEINNLAVQFKELSPKCYFRNGDFSIAHPTSFMIYLYDFSLFFRFFPLLSQQNLKAEHYLSAMLGMNLVEDNQYFTRDDLSEEEKYLLNNVFVHFKNQFVITESEQEALHQQVLKFIEAFTTLFFKILDMGQYDLGEIAARAYHINEDRYYMFPVCNISYYLCFAEPHYSSFHINRLITLTINACQRNPDRKQSLVAELKLFEEGYCYFELDKHGFYQIVACLFNNQQYDFQQEPKLILDEKEYPLFRKGEGVKVQYVTQKLPIAHLAHTFLRNYSLNYPKVKIIDSKKAISLTPLVNLRF